MTFWSLFSGIGGFDAAFAAAGMEPVLHVEREPDCLSVLRRHWADVQHCNDIEKLRAYREPRNAGRHAAEFVRPELICGGFPCQDLSVAGKRAGLAGGRSGLWFVFRRVIALQRPRWVCIENVPGLLSSNGGRDMGTILWSLGQLGYGWAYRVLDAQWFGVAQRRRRVFIVGCLGDCRRAGEVLFESDSLPWDPAPSREKKPSIAGTLDAGAGVRRGAGINPGSIVNTLDRHMGSGGPDDNAAQAGHLIAHTLRAEGFDASEDGTGRGTPIIPILEVGKGTTSRGVGPNGCGIGHDGDPMFTLQAGAQHAVAFLAFAQNQRDEVRDLGDLAGTIAAEPGMKQQTYTMTGMAVRRLTPRECERLQGFPDDWTRWRHDGTEISDSARYRMLGNAVCVNVAEWIGRRIMEQAK